MKFDPYKYKNLTSNRYDSYLKMLDFDTSSINETVDDAVSNIIEKKTKSFVIYGEPQSGKTSMMIALTAKLLDEGFKFIVILVQDNLTLERQNFDRFQKSGLNPSPKLFYDILPREVKVNDGLFVVFCKKNTSNLLKLLKRVDHVPNKIIIDDEADYASPNSKINRADEKGIQLRTRINERICNLLKKNGIYIGVTATPARLDLNNTFSNEHHRWSYFRPHKSYKGQDFFFPLKTKDKDKIDLGYNLHFLKSETTNEGGELRDAIYRFMINAAFCNLYINNYEKNYIMLVHTSVKMEKHKEDQVICNKLFSDLKNKGSRSFLKHMERIEKLAFKKTENEKQATEITSYIANNGDRNQIGILNSDKTNNYMVDITKFSEDPPVPFTISIGGNVISRGITFNNLMGMFFTRGVKNIMQQDTYIQRARMFGSRDKDINQFELTIPEDLYKQWYSCFFLHRLSYLSAQNNLHPVWLEGIKTRAVAPASIDRANVNVDRGMMSFEKVKFKKSETEKLLKAQSQLPDNKRNHKLLLYELSKIYGNAFIPKHVIDLIETESGNNDYAVAIHPIRNIENYSDTSKKDRDIIQRARGFFGTNEYKTYNLAKHHFQIIYNNRGYCRMVYNFRHGKVAFLKNRKNNSLSKLSII